MRQTHIRAALGVAVAAALALSAAACSAATRSPSGAGGQRGAVRAQASQVAGRPFLDRFHLVSQIASTVPGNGDVNPYGVTVVPSSTGSLVRGDVLVSNFNAKTNLQGTGTTIVEVSPRGSVRQFARLSELPAGMHCPGGIGLTTALAVLPGGWVVVGSLPTTRGGALPAVNPIGCLIVLNDRGKPAETWTGPQLDGPWDMTVASEGGHTSLFVSNVLSRPAKVTGRPAKTGLCEVVRISIEATAGGMPRMQGLTVIGTGFPWELNKAALVLGPTGLALARTGTLYAANTLSSTITAIPDALSRTSPVQYGTHVLARGGGLDAPLGLTTVPGGDLVAVNGNNGNAVEIAPDGRQVASAVLVPGGAGDLFGLAPAQGGQGLLFVNDGTNTLDLFSG